MAKRTVSVAYEDPRFSRKEAAYWSQVRNALDAMGAPNSGELLHNSKTYVEGVYRAGLPAIDAAAVIWHQHCGKAGQKETPCVAEDSLVSGEPWKLLEPGLWEWQTSPYPPGGYAIAQKPRKGGFELGRWDSRIGRPSFAALAIYPSLDAAQNAAAMYASLPGGRETAEVTPAEKIERVKSYVRTRYAGDTVTSTPVPVGNGIWQVTTAKHGTVRIEDKEVELHHEYTQWVNKHHKGSKLTEAAECPCEADGAEETSKLRAVKYLKVGDTINAPSPSGQSLVAATIRAKQPATRHFTRGGAYNIFVSRVGGHATDQKEWGFYALDDDRFEVIPATSEARDSAPACVPFTRLERNNEAFAACQAIANGPLEDDRAMYRLLSAQLGKEDQEVFVVVGLDLHRNLRSYTEVARGQRDRVTVNVEDVLRAAILDGPHGFVVAHNHPSGKANPSPADRDLTKRIRAGAAVGCPSIVFLDHIVVGQGEYFSFADNKLKRVR
jgi:hypothetical protein